MADGSYHACSHKGCRKAGERAGKGRARRGSGLHNGQVEFLTPAFLPSSGECGVLTQLSEGGRSLRGGGPGLLSLESQVAAVSPWQGTRAPAGRRRPLVDLGPDSLSLRCRRG